MYIWATGFHTKQEIATAAVGTFVQLHPSVFYFILDNGTVV